MSEARPISSEIDQQRVVDLLADPQIQAGLDAAQGIIGGYHRELEIDGNFVEPITSGVTAEGMCVDIARYGTDANNAARYAVFVYRLQDVSSASFLDDLSPRQILEIHQRGAYLDIEAQHPEDPRPMSSDEENDALTEHYAQPGAEIEEAPRAWADWIERNRLTIPRGTSTNSANFRGIPIESFENAAFGHRRQAIADLATASLRRLIADYSPGRERLGLGLPSLSAPPRKPGGEQIIPLLQQRIDNTEAAMRANPVYVDEHPDAIHDPAKAVHIAYAIKKEVEKLQDALAKEARGKSPWTSSTERQSRVDRALQEADRAYDADPLGVFEK